MLSYHGRVALDVALPFHVPVQPHALLLVVAQEKAFGRMTVVQVAVEAGKFALAEVQIFGEVSLAAQEAVLLLVVE